jgi:hypothetical protein
MMATPPRWSARRRRKTADIFVGEKDNPSGILTTVLLRSFASRWQQGTVLDLKGTFSGGAHSKIICLKCPQHFSSLVSGDWPMLQRGVAISLSISFKAERARIGLDQ